MNPSLKKRFWKDVTVEAHDTGFGIALDGRRLKTPSKADLQVPKRTIAEMIAAEWDAQIDLVNPEVMPATRWANSAIDKVAPQRGDVVSMLAEYGASDLLCYRAPHPDALIKAQETAWDPLLEWAENHLNAPLGSTRGIRPIAQPNQSIRNLESALTQLSNWQIAAIHDLVTISGSLILALAIYQGEISAQKAWETSRIDELWQEKLWGTDEESEKSAAAKRQSFLFADKIMQLLG